MRKNKFSPRPAASTRQGGGVFIVFEGLDGSGQSTQANLLKDYLQKQGFEVVLTKEPTPDSKAGKKIKRILDKKESLSATELQKLFAQDRKEHLENLIIPALKQGKIVISDRYFFSSFTYGTADGADLNYLIKINKNFLLPDLTIFLKVSPEVCLQKIKNKGKEKTLFEKEEKLEKVWKVYEMLTKKFSNVIIIDGEKTIKEVFSEVKKVVHSKLNI